MANKFIIIDGNAILHRAWHALPPLTTPTGEMVNAAYGFTLILMKALKDIQPKYAAVTFDRKEKTFRHEMYTEYKATRVKQPDELYAQIPIIKKIVTAFGMPIYEKERFEADDVIATICKNKEVNKPDVESIVVTGDMDTLQLVDDNTKVYALRKGITDTVIYDEGAVLKKYELRPDQLNDFKAMRGDPSDNIPGAKGIGDVGAAALIKEFGSIEKMYEAIEKNDTRLEKFKPRLIEILKKEKDNVFLGKKLVTLVSDAPVDFYLGDCKIKIDPGSVAKIFKDLGFMSLLKKVDELAGGAQSNLL
ncbi:MAG: 5'-3' exonuclease H3TH domain-containing protein [Patescibacteria group bacterium]